MVPKPGMTPVVQVPATKKCALLQRTEHGKGEATTKPEQSKGQRGKNTAKSSQEAEQADVGMEDDTKGSLAQGNNGGGSLTEVPVTNVNNGVLPGSSASIQCEHASNNPS